MFTMVAIDATSADQGCRRFADRRAQDRAIPTTTDGAFMNNTRISPTRHRRPLVKASLVLIAVLGVVGCSGSENSASPTDSAAEVPEVSPPISEPTATTTTTDATPDVTSPTGTDAPAGNQLLPDDALLVFQRGGIRVSDATGDSEVEVVPDHPDSEHPDWSPDGLSILFDTEFSTIWSVPSEGGDAEELVTCVAPCANLYEGAWSPDGAQIAYAMAETQDGTNTARSSIQVLDLATGATRSVYENTSGAVWLFTPRWSPDGSSIVFTESTFASTRLDEGEITSERIAVVEVGETTSSARYLTPEGAVSNSPDWSPIGDLIVYASEDNLFSIQPDASGITQLTSFDGEQEHAIQPSFLPDGSGIVFTYVTGTFDVDDQPQAAVIGLDGNGFVVLGHSEPVTHPRVNPASM